MNLEELGGYRLSLTHATKDMPFDEGVLVFRIYSRMFALTSLKTRPLRVSLKCDPGRAIELHKQYPDKVVAGYHLNKRHWSTVSLGDSPFTLIKEMIRHSYGQVLAKVPKKERKVLIY